jgi:outer membrane protein insertion porin family
MKHRWGIAFYLLSFLTTSMAFGAPIAEIKFEGLKRIEAEAVAEKMTLKKGDEPRPDRVAEDIKNIFSLGYFEDVEMLQSGNKLIVRLRERPVVTQIEYEGAEEFEKKDLEEATTLKAFNVIGIDKINKAKDAILKKYEEKGYYLARVDYKLEPLKEGNASEVKLVFNIQENPKVWIRKIFLQGNKVFPSDALKRIMITAEGHAMSWASGGGTFREAAFERDLAALAYFYGNEGYIEATFGKPRVTLSQDRRYIDIIIDVNEGRKFTLDSVTFTGDDLFTTDELRKAFLLSDGDVFSTGKLQESILALTDKYGDQGYAFANVIPKTKTNPETNKVALAISVERGEKVYWGKITITGNKTTHDKVIRRELLFTEGELYNATKRRKSLEHIQRLGFFGQDVNFVTSAPEGSNDSMNLEIRVTEKPAGTLMVQAGYGSNQGFSFGANISHANLFGLGQQLAFSLNFAAKSQKTFNFQFTDPKVFDSEWLAGIDLYISENPVGGTPKTYQQRLEGGALRIGREIYEDVTLYGSYKAEAYHLNDLINPAILTSPKDREAFISSITGTLALDKRNNRLDPSSGVYLMTSAEMAGLGGRVFQKFLLNARWYHRVIGSLVYRSNYEFGWLSNFMTDDEVPDNERYILGGMFSLRGWPMATIGPTRYVKNIRDKKKDGSYLYPDAFPYPIGGTKKMVMNHELEFPLIPEADIRIVLFFDAGNAWEGQFGLLKPTILADYGWGIRWYSPMGPLRFEFGYPLVATRSKPNKGVEFHFNIAPTF